MENNTPTTKVILGIASITFGLITICTTSTFLSIVGACMIIGGGLLLMEKED